MTYIQKRQLSDIFQTYLDEFDDYNEAKDIFINDLNTTLFKKFGDTHGVTDYAKIKDALNQLISDIG